MISLYVSYWFNRYLTFIDMSMKSVIGVALAAYKEQHVLHYSCFTVDTKMKFHIL